MNSIDFRFINKSYQTNLIESFLSKLDSLNKNSSDAFVFALNKDNCKRKGSDRKSQFS